MLLIAVAIMRLNRTTNSQAPPEKNTDTLLEQVRGDEIHWNEHGEVPSWTDLYCRRDFHIAARSFAIRDLARMGESARSAVPELHQLLIQHGDYCPGDGVISYRSDIARCLGQIGDGSSVDTLISFLRERARTPDPKDSVVHTDQGTIIGIGDLAWHLNEASLLGDYSVEGAYWGHGNGPEGIMDGLVLFNREHYPRIYADLLELRAELDSIDLINTWLKNALDKAIQFFESSEDKQDEIRRRIIEHNI